MAAPEPRDIAISHHSLANLLFSLGDARARQWAHRPGAALLLGPVGMRYYLGVVLCALAADGHDLG